MSSYGFIAIIAIVSTIAFIVSLMSSASIDRAAEAAQPSGQPGAPGHADRGSLTDDHLEMNFGLKHPTDILRTDKMARIAEMIPDDTFSSPQDWGQ